ncbi:hypothetical protein WJX72_000465 [[Myrmecia] bisecta]|uniref:Uncharacterized protein n=1 Tax=[Myrmecia] bisecta TaxID=41462 RepID=A0AAW1PJS4_9CHLO
MPLAPSSSMDAASTGTGGSARSEASFKGWAPALRAEPAAHAATPPGAFSFASQPVGPAPTLQATHSKALEAVPMADDAFLSNTDLDLALDLNFDSLDPSKWEEIKGTPAPADSSQQQLAQGLYGPNPTQFLSSHAQPGAAMAQDQHQLSLTPSLEPWGLNLGSRGSFEEFGVGESTYSAFSEGRAGVPPTSAGPCTGPCNFQMLFQREHDI